MAFIRKHKKSLLYGAGLLLLVLLVWRTDHRKILEAARNLEAWQLAVLLAFQVVTIFLLALQWYVTARHMKQDIALSHLVEMQMTGTFFESVTPAAKTGGEAYRVLYLRHKGYETVRSGALVTAQKMISMTAFVSVVSVSVFFFIFQAGFEAQTRQWVVGLYGLFMLLILGTFFFATRLIGGKKVPRLLSRYETAIQHTRRTFKKSLSPLSKQKHYLLVNLLIGYLIWLLYGFKAFFLLSVFGVDVGFFAVALSVYIAYMVGMLPLTPGGLGTLEATFVVLLSGFGVLGPVALVVVLTMRLATFWFSLLVSVIYLFIAKIFGRRITPFESSGPTPSNLEPKKVLE